MACTVYHVRRVHATFTGRLPDADGRGGASERRLRVANYYGRRRAILLTNNTATIGRVTGALMPCSRHHKWQAACATRRYTDWAEHSACADNQGGTDGAEHPPSDGTVMRQTSAAGVDLVVQI